MNVNKSLVMYKILHIPTTNFIYRQYTSDIASINWKRDLTFYSVKEAEKHLRRCFKLIRIYNRGLVRKKFLFSSYINRRRYFMYRKQTNWLEQGYSSKYGIVEYRNNVTFYGDITALCFIIGYPVDHKVLINLSRTEFLIVRV